MPVSTISLSAIIIILFSSFSTIDAKKRIGFLYICIGKGCTSGHIALTLLSIVVSIGLWCLYACMKRPVNLKHCLNPNLSSNEDEITNNTNQRTNANESNSGDELV